MKNILPVLISIIGLGSLLFSPSCANVSTPPSGGPKDTIPPVLVRTTPDYNAVNFSSKRIELKFNEFPKLNDVINQIYLSPPQAKRPVAVVRGKSVVVTFDAPLDTNTTYALHFGQSIVDNNEGNPFGAYTFSFSTGAVIDSLLLTGYVVDAQTLLPLDNISVMLHIHVTDTTIYKMLPRAMAKTDLWGYFSVMNLKQTPYHLFAVEDLNRNNKYDDNNERIAFLDSLFTPQTVIDAHHLHRIHTDDTLSMLSRPVERTLYLFKELPKRQVLREKVRPQPRHFFLTFSVPNAQVSSLQIEGVDSLSLIREHSLYRDTLHYWIEGAHVPDTLKVVIHYFKTDSLNQLSIVEEKLALALPGRREGPQSSATQVDTVRTDLLKVEINAKPDFVEQTGFSFSFGAYPVAMEPEQMTLKYTTARNEEETVPFTFIKDSLNGTKYTLIPQKWIPTVSYELKVPQGIFKDVYGYLNDSLNFNVSLPEADKFGSFSFTLKGGEGFYIVELLSNTRDKVVRSVHVPSGGKGVFPYLTDDTYVIRITEDRNGNGVWDTGSVDQQIPPERVRFYRLSNGNDLIEIKDKRELDQTIDIDELFHHDAPPIIPSKTKR